MNTRVLNIVYQMSRCNGVTLDTSNSRTCCVNVSVRKVICERERTPVVLLLLSVIYGRSG